MNKRQLQEIINNNLRLIEPSNKIGSHVGCVRPSAANSWEHELKKFEICYKDFTVNNVAFITEAKLISGGRPDIINLEGSEIIEIVKTETEASLIEKSNKYPGTFNIRIVRV